MLFRSTGGEGAGSDPQAITKRSQTKRQRDPAGTDVKGKQQRARERDARDAMDARDARDARKAGISSVARVARSHVVYACREELETFVV